MDSIDKTFIKTLFTADYYTAYRAVENYVAKVVYGILHDMNITRYMHTHYRTADEIGEFFTVHDQARPLLQWMLQYAELMGYAQRRGTGYVMEPISDSAFNVDADSANIVTLSPTADIFIQLVRHIAKNMDNFFIGRKNGGDILFSDQTISLLWDDYFNNRFYGYSTVNSCAAYGITKWFSHSEGQRMLEVGSGTSGATVKVFQMLRDNNLLGAMQTIILTDIVPALLDRGKKNIHQWFPSPPRFEQKILDINDSLNVQGFADNSFDIIYGVNVLHIARNLSRSLQGLYNLLKKGGILVIAETIRPREGQAMHHEIIFELLENYYNVTLDPEIRPYHGFLTTERWLRFIELAGFSNIEYITELDRHDELAFDIKPLHSLLVIKGQK